MGLNYLSNPYWLPASRDNDCSLQQSLEFPQESGLDLDLDNLVCFQDDFTLADTSIDPLFFHPSQRTFIPQPQPETCHFDQLQLDFQQQQQQSCYSNNKRQKRSHHYSNQQDEAVLPCNNNDHPFFDSQLVNQTSDEAGWLLPDVTFPPVFASGGSVGNNSNNNGCGRRVEGGEGGLSAQSIAARQRRRKIADKTQELGKLIPGGHKMNTADMFHSASMYVKFLQAQIAILSPHYRQQLTRGTEGCHEEQFHLKLLAESSMVQEKLYTQEKCLAPHKLLKSLSKDSKLQSDHPFLVQQINTFVMPAQARH